ncbi:MAG: hypothetical protein JWP87_5713 [Labilithrix sp.]|nr:hypothetical protein [Labilithrix sp.]
MDRFLIGVGSAAALVGALMAGCGSDGAGEGPTLDSGDASVVVDGGSSTDAGTTDSAPLPAQAFAVGGTVTGLLGTGMVLQNGGDTLTVNANGTFVFPTKVAKGGGFAVTIKNQPTAPSQTCTVTGGTGAVATANVTSIVVNCATNKFSVGGTVAGLAGTGLVLQDNAGDDVTVGANGSFAFPTAIADTGSYAVTVKKQPTNLSQTCTVTSGSGTIAGANVTNVSVACVTNQFTVGGTVTGLMGAGLVLQNNGAGDLAVAADGSFTFTSPQDDGSHFAVTVKTDPSGPAQTCLVSGNSGDVAGGKVTSVTVNCSTKKYAIGGTISGLAGAGLVLQDNAGDNLTVNANGTFAFATPIEDLAAYSVTVLAQPTSMWQTCVVTNGSGNVTAAPITNVSVVCTTNSYTVAGNVTGLAGSGLVLQNSAGNNLAVNANGAFQFTAPVASGAGYLVSVLTNPSNKSQTCTVTSGIGTIAGANVTNVAVACVTNKYTVGGSVSGLAAGNSVVLRDNGGDNLTVAANGTFTFATSLESGQAFAVTVLTQPTTPNQTCTVSGGTGSVAAGNVVSVSVNCATNTYTAGGSISGLAGTGLVLQNNAAGDLPLNANGSFAFAPQLDGTGYAITVKTQPTSRSQTCTVTNGTGTIAGANAAVTVACTTNTYTVSGTITGLTAAGLVLTDNGVDDKSLANGATAFTFATSIASGNSYAVAVKTQPAGRTCTVTNGSGTVGGANVTNVAVTCSLSGECNVVNGIRWCRDTADARSCNTFCSSIGLGNPTISDAAWLAAQDTSAECQQIASAFGLGGGISLSDYTYACTEQVFTMLFCSTLAGCPTNHRTTSSGVGHRAICPCQ